MANVLIIDDEKSIRITLAHFLEQEGHIVHAVGDAPTAIDWLEEHAVDVIVTDIILPRVNGVELIQRARDIQPRAKVIMITGEPTIETASQAVRAGVHDYLAKPIGKADVIRCVASAAHVKALEDERERLAEENLRYQNHLEELVRERTKALEQQIVEREKAEEERQAMQQQFLQAQKLEAVGRLAGGVAHDFNNILMALGGAAEFAREALPEDSAPRQDVEDIIRLADDAAALVRQLLAFSRQQALNRKPIDLNERIEGLLKMLRRLIGEDIDLHFDPREDLRTVLVDPGQIEQIVMNMAVNARDAMPDGGEFTLKTSVVNLDDKKRAAFVDPDSVPPGDYVCLTISDTGCGMSENTLEHVFEPFFTTKQRRGGTGLGLASVYGIVQQHRGGITVRSEVGRGTTFEIYFPMTEKAGKAEKDEKIKAELPGGTESILLVEDDHNVRHTLGRQLRALGYDVTDVPNAEAALSQCKDHSFPFDLLLVDLVLPDITGTELASKIQSRHPDLNVIFMSGYAADKRALEDIQDTGLPFISKPFPREELATKIRDLLDDA